jgi:hypothetical protein
MMIIQARQTKLQDNLNIVIGGVGKFHMLIFTLSTFFSM